jgi:hypothetical protein
MSREPPQLPQQEDERHRHLLDRAAQVLNDWRLHAKP